MIRVVSTCRSIRPALGWTARRLVPVSRHWTLPGRFSNVCSISPTDAARSVLDDWSAASFDPATLEANIDDLSVLRSTLTASGGGIWWSVTPIASKVEAYDADRARVSVWVCQIVGSTVDPARGGDAIAPTVDFRTATIDMVWTAGSGWSIWATAATDGPVPMMAATSTMTSPIEFMDTLGSFTLVKEHS